MHLPKKRPCLPSSQLHCKGSGDVRVDDSGDVVAERGQDKNDVARTFCLEGDEDMLPLLGLVNCMEPNCDLHIF